MRQTTIAALAAMIVLAAGLLGSCSKQNEQQNTTANENEEQQTSVAAASTETGEMTAELSRNCPIVVKGTTVDLSDTGNGIAMAFTTHTGDVAELRERVQRLGRMYEAMDAKSTMMWHQMGNVMGQSTSGQMGQGHGEMMGQGRTMQQGEMMEQSEMMAQGQTGERMTGGPMPVVTSATEPIEYGMRLVLTPKDPSQLESLRQHARAQQERMQSGECWMLQNKASSPGAE